MYSSRNNIDRPARTMAVFTDNKGAGGDDYDGRSQYGRERLYHGDADPTKNPVTRLFEFCAAHKIACPEFVIVTVDGNPRRPRHAAECLVRVDEKNYCRCESKTRRDEVNIIH